MLRLVYCMTCCCVCLCICVRLFIAYELSRVSVFYVFRALFFVCCHLLVCYVAVSLLVYTFSLLCIDVFA